MQEELSNESVRLKVEKQPKCRVQLVIEATAPLVRAAHKKAIRAVAKEVAIPGFRKGKAPDAMVLKNYPKQVDQQWQDYIAQSAYQESSKLSAISPLDKEARISFQMKNHSLDKAELTLTFEVEPTPPSIDPQAIALKPVLRPEVNGDKVAETIRQAQLFFATWTPITDRPVQEGDFVILNVDVIEEDPPSPLFTDTRFEVTSHSMAEWMRILVVGMNLGESKEGMSVPDQDLPADEKENFKPKKVRLTVNAIESATFPPLTDEFAKTLGASSVDDLRSRIETLLNEQADAHVKEKLREQVNEHLLNHCPFELPATLIHRETEFRLRQLWEDPDFQTEWKQLTEQKRKTLISSMSEQAERAVRMFYLCRKVVTDAHIKISPNDLPKPPSTPLEMLIGNRPAHPSGLSPDTRQAEAFSRLLLEKAQDHLIALGKKD